VLKQEWNFQRSAVIHEHVKKKAKAITLRRNEIVICADRAALAAYLKTARSLDTKVEDREIKRIYPDVKRKLFIESIDGYVKMLGDLLPNDMIVIEGLATIHGKDETWLLHINTTDSRLVGFVHGWYAVGQLLGYVYTM